MLSLQEYCHCFSTCNSLEWCGTCKRLMSIETFRHNANYRQTYTDISLVNRQATCMLQAHYRWQILLQLCHWMIMKIMCINAFFFPLWDNTFKYYFLKKGKIIFQQLSGILVLSWVVIRCLCHPFCYRSLEISSTLSNKSIK